MKKFKKINKLFICEECNELFKTLRGLSTHIQFKHNNKEYYNKWLKDYGDDLCKICQTPTQFINMSRGYNKGCCREHIIKWNHIKIREAIFKKYGVKSILCIKKYKEKGMIKKYGVNNPFKSKEIKDKIKKTNLKKYGVENAAKSQLIKEKIVNTCIKNLGVKYPTQSIVVKDKIKKTFLKHYNVEYALQNNEFRIYFDL